MVLFPEGGFLRKRRETSQKYVFRESIQSNDFIYNESDHLTRLRGRVDDLFEFYDWVKILVNETIVVW